MMDYFNNVVFELSKSSTDVENYLNGIHVP